MKKGLLKTMMFLFIAATVVSISSCKKETSATCSNGVKDGDETGVDCGGSCTACSALSGKVKSIKQDGSVNTIDYGYDSNGRISFVVNNGDTTKYSYTTNTVTITDPSGDAVVYTLNSQGQAVSSDDGLSYIYSSDGYLLEKSYGSTVLESYEYSNGNRVKVTDAGGNALLISYYNDLDNRNDRIGDMEIASSFLGKGSKNLANQVTEESTGDILGGNSYELNSANQVVKQTLTNNGSAAVVLRYTYY